MKLSQSNYILYIIRGEFGWDYHIYLEHNVYHMVFYLLYLKNKNLNECDALEKYIKECIESKNT